MAEFKKQGGILTGREERYDWFEGEPRSVGGNVGTVNTAISGSPALPSSQGGQSQPVQGGGADNKPVPVPGTISQTPSIQAPERRSSMPPQSQQQTQAPVIPSLNVPDSNPNPFAPQQPQQPSHPASSTTQATPVNPGAGPAHPGAAPGRWSLLPMHFARSDGDAARAGQQHPPTRSSASSSAAARPSVGGTGRATSSAGVPPAQQAPSRYPGNDK